MDRASALRFLSPLHAEALVLAEQGIDRARLAELLDIDAGSIGPLLRIARAKLAALELQDEPTGWDGKGGQRG